jgi:hypothetical protein
MSLGAHHRSAAGLGIMVPGCLVHRGSSARDTTRHIHETQTGLGASRKGRSGGDLAWIWVGWGGSRVASSPTKCGRPCRSAVALGWMQG